MANGGDVLTMLCPNVEWTLAGNNYDDIDWFGKEPAITKEQFEAGFDQFDLWEANRIETIKQKREQALSKLTELGLEIEELKALGL